MPLSDLLNLPSKTRGHRYSPNLDELMMLRYTANQSFMTVSGQLLGLSATSAYKAIHQVIDRLCSLHDLLITFPDDLRPTKYKYRLKSGFPNIIGAIDCTHTKVQSFGRESGERHRNRKGFFPPECSICLRYQPALSGCRGAVGWICVRQ